MSSSSGWRLWGLVIAAAVTAVAVTGIVSGAGSGSETVFVPVAPCRLVDTRPNVVGQTPINVGPRSIPIGANDPVQFTAWGSGDSNSPCDVPNTATAISANVTIVAPTANGYLTVYPADLAAPPNASNLNYVAGQAATPNAVTTTLSPSGALKVYNRNGTVHVIIDINGYYQPSTRVGATGPAGPAGPTGLTGPAGPAGIASGAACTVAGVPGVVEFTIDHMVRCATPGDVTTMAGTVGVAGSTNANSANAKLNGPRGVTVDGSGNVYVADYFNHLIRKITPTGDVTTLAGTTGVAGSTNAIVGTSASFNYPEGVAVDGSGNVYVADTSNHLIRKITPTGEVTTLAGTAGVSGSTNANGTNAKFYFPYGVAVDGSGNVYVADAGNNLIRKITPTGTVTTLAGTVGVSGSTNANGTNATFDTPIDVAVDGSGNVYVADYDNHLIRKITPTGDVTTLAGTVGVSGSINANGTNATFAYPFGVAVGGSGNVYVADTNNHLIRKITPTGDVTTLAGTVGVSGSTNANSTSATFNSPKAVAVDGSGHVYVADFDNHLVRKIN